jgi:hypothetical protein
MPEHDDGHLHVVFDGPITINVVTQKPRSSGAVTAILSIGGSIMADVTLSIDDVTGDASVKFVDDKGDIDAPAPAGYVPAFASDTPATLTVDPATGVITPLAEGTSTVSAPVNDVNGNPIALPDGSGNYATQAVLVTIGPGLAVAAVETVTP